MKTCQCGKDNSGALAYGFCCAQPLDKGEWAIRMAPGNANKGETNCDGSLNCP